MTTQRLGVRMRVILFLLKLVKRVMPQGTLTVTVKKGLPIEVETKGA